MEQGTVQYWDLWRGFGFIRPDDPEQPNVHAHVTKLEGFPGFGHLVAGERVRYEAVPGEVDDQGNPRQSATRVMPPDGRLGGTVEDFDVQRGYGSLLADDGERFFLHHANILGEGMRSADPGDEATFVAGEGHPDRQALDVKLCDPRKALYRFADFPVPDRWLPSLERLARREVWDYRHELAGKGGAMPILRHYVEETFSWVHAHAGTPEDGRPGGVVELEYEGREYACINTGLASEQQESIFALFVRNKNPERAPWFWRAFYKESDRQLPVDSPTDLPGPPDFFSDPALLIYDPQRELIVDYEHVVGDHLERFPEPLRGNETLAQAALMGAVSRIPDRVRRNYKTAVPQHYRGQIQLLLPLSLLDPSKVDLTLVVERRGDRAYRGNTVLGLDLAYRQARLVARPDPEWLGEAWNQQDQAQHRPAD